MLATITYQRIFFHLHLGLDGERLSTISHLGNRTPTSTIDTIFSRA